MTGRNTSLGGTQGLESRAFAGRRRRAITARRRRRQIRAILAGGLVLGFGASATVAAWTDQENATGEFQTGIFALEASTTPNPDDGWTSENTMQFNATNMYPGDEVYAPVSIRTSPDTTMSGEVTIDSPETAEGLTDYLSYRVVVLNEQASECGASSFDSVDATMSPLSSPPQNNEPRELASAGGNEIKYCFHVQLDADTPNSLQGHLTEQTWVWEATSVDEG